MIKRGLNEQIQTSHRDDPIPRLNKWQGILRGLKLTQLTKDIVLDFDNDWSMNKEGEDLVKNYDRLKPLEKAKLLSTMNRIFRFYAEMER